MNPLALRIALALLVPTLLVLGFDLFLRRPARPITDAADASIDGAGGS